MNSRLALGTVQFGLNYGIANSSGQPSEILAHSIMDFALDMGICDFDTARAYGASEQVLGTWIRKNEARIVSKHSGASEGISIAKSLHDSVCETIRNIGCSSLYGYLLHREEMLNDREWLEGISALKQTGLVQKVGISLYDPASALAAAEASSIDIIQIPYSVMDQRLDQCGFFDRAKVNSKEVWARSAFVQGLLFLEEQNVPEHLKGIVAFRNIAEKIGERYGYSMQQLSILFSLGNSGIDRVLIGVDSLSQLQEYEGIEDKLDGYRECREELIHALRGKVDPYLVSPHKWRTA